MPLWVAVDLLIVSPIHGAMKSYTFCHLLTNYFHGEGPQTTGSYLGQVYEKALLNKWLFDPFRSFHFVKRLYISVSQTVGQDPLDTKWIAESWEPAT